MSVTDKQERESKRQRDTHNTTEKNTAPGPQLRGAEPILFG
jgi:hypothetical protein